VKSNMKEEYDFSNADQGKFYVPAEDIHIPACRGQFTQTNILPGATMQVVYTVNADELGTDFLESIKTLFAHKTIAVEIHDLSEASKPLRENKPSKFSPFPSSLPITREEMNERHPDYLTMTVDKIIMPPRDERYDR